ncbi:MAG: cytochrome C assembly protein [Anaerolineae bacterium]|nr:MAG: cytochrome C assembly protein [Anaerolineae bacterium]
METKPRWLTVLDVLTAIFFVVAVFLVFVFAPMERTMGLVQKVFYFHVATAWVGMLGFMVAAVAGILYLIKGDRQYDTLGLAAVEISLVFFFVAIIMGSVWARPIWNTWWTWDPRLTTATIVELIYAAYIMLRQGIEDPDRRARFGAVYAILGFLSVPLTFISIRLLRTIHPVVIGSGDPSAEGAFNMSPRMKVAFFYSLFTFSVVFVDLLLHRLRMGKLAARVEELRLKVSA